MKSKFRRAAVVISAAATMIVGTDLPASADVGDPGWYVGLRALPAFSQAEDEAIIGGPGGTFRQTSGGLRPSIGGGAMVGYHWSGRGLPVRTEIEYVYRVRLDFDTEAAGPPKTGYEDNVDSDGLMLNLFYDLDTWSWWRPFVGGGLGWARNSSETRRTNIATGVSVEQDNTTDNFAYSAMAGVRVAVSRNWVAEVGYRFIDLGEIDSGRFGTGDIVTADAYLAHEFLIGVVYIF